MSEKQQQQIVDETITKIANKTVFLFNKLRFECLF